MKYTDNTNIRFHIFKELSKHRDDLKKSHLDRINEFAIPVFSGINTILLSSVLGQDWVTDRYYRILFYLLVPFFLYLFFYKTSKLLLNLWKTKIVFKYGNQTNNDAETTKKEEEDLARFNYEVTNLVQTAYLLSNNTKSKDNIQGDFNLMESILYIENVLAIIQKISFTEKFSRSRICFILSAIEKTITRHKECGLNVFEDEVANNMSNYNIVVDKINRIYGSGLKYIS